MDNTYISSTSLHAQATILVIEDDRVFREQLCRFLVSQSHRAVAAGSVEEARDLISTHRYDLALLDIQLPDGSGLEFTREIPYIPVLYISGVRDDAAIERALQENNNVIGFLSKPVTMEQFSLTLTAALAVGRFLRDRRRINRLLMSELERLRLEYSARLHDGLGQHLVGQTLMLENLRLILNRVLEGRAGHVEVLGVLDDMIDQTRQMKQKISAMVADFGTGTMHYESLSGGLHALVSDWRKKAPHIEIVLETDDDLLSCFPDDEQAILYQVVQEALTNAIQHGLPSNVSIRLSRSRNGSALEGEILDDGKGLHANGCTGFGLNQMEARIDSLGGILEVTPASTGGTRIAFRVPMPGIGPGSDSLPPPAVPASKKQLITLFLEQADSLLRTIETPSSDADWSLAMHTLAGSAEVIGDRDVATLARSLENKLPVDTSQEELARLRSLIERYRHDAP